MSIHTQMVAWVPLVESGRLRLARMQVEGSGLEVPISPLVECMQGLATVAEVGAVSRSTRGEWWPVCSPAVGVLLATDMHTVLAMVQVTDR